MTRTYETVPGFFTYDDPEVIASRPSFPPPFGPLDVPPSFGLVDTSPDRWHRFKARISQLKDDADKHTSYKVLFFGRHGEGYHNVAEAKYGTEVWDKHWAKLNTDGEMVWGPDPRLTAVGEGQAVTIREAWSVEKTAGIPLPEKLYCSPLNRALKTCELMFEGITPHDRKVLIIEDLRSPRGQRSTRTIIKATFPQFEIEEGFVDEDEIFNTNVEEPKPLIEARTRRVLDRIFGNDQETYISITAHGGLIDLFLVSLGRPAYALPTGAVIPVVVKSTVQSP